MKSFILIPFTFFNFLITAAYDRNVELFEGSFCDMEEENEKGVCVPLPQCWSRLQQVLKHQRRATDVGRCGFRGHIEIVCCPVNEVTKNHSSLPIFNTEKVGRLTDFGKPPRIYSKITPTTPLSNSKVSTTTDSTNFLKKLNLRPADVACINYEEKITGEMGGRVFPNIVNGQRAAFGEFPYMVALGYKRNDDSSNLQYICGGTLISPLYVLTAAHCINNIDNLIPVQVKLGAVNLKKNISEEQNIDIKKITSYPLYKRSLNYHDIGIIELKNSVSISKSVMPICLQTKPIPNLEQLVNLSLVVTGWGATSFENEGSEDLQKTPDLEFVKLNECKNFYEGFPKLSHGLDESMICVLDKNISRSSDACQGDSGGPLLLLSSGSNTVIGVTSFGQSCGSRIPSVYTSVYFYLDWIESIVWQNKK